MEDLETLQVAIEEWLNGDPDNRHIFIVMGDYKTHVSSSGMEGESSDICSAIVNEMLADEELAKILIVAVDAFNEMKRDLEKEVNEEIKKPTKKYLS